MAESHTGKMVEILISFTAVTFAFSSFCFSWWNHLPKTYLRYILYANNSQTSFFQIDEINKKINQEVCLSFYTASKGFLNSKMQRESQQKLKDINEFVADVLKAYSVSARLQLLWRKVFLKSW